MEKSLISPASANDQSAQRYLKVFYQLLGNTLVASVINFTVWFAITFFVYLETRSVFATAIIAGIYLALVSFSGFWFGSLVDHYHKRRVVLFSSLATLALYGISFVVYITTDPAAFKDAASPTLWAFVLLLMIGVIIGNIRTIALPTLVTILIPEDRRDKANGLAGTASGISFLITSVISGLLVGLGGMYYVLILAIIMTLAAIVHFWFIPIPEREVVHAGAEPKKVDIRGTLAVITLIPGLLALFFSQPSTTFWAACSWP